MTGPLRERWERILGFVRGGRADRDLEAEIAAHIEMAAEDHARSGMNPEEARRLAAMKFGTRLSAREQVSDQRGLPGLESFLTDLRFAVRMMRKSPGFTVVAVTMLALGIGINATVFAVTNAAVFKGFPLVRGNDRLLYMTTNRWCCVSYPDFEDWRAQATSFEGMALVHGLGTTVTDQSGFAERYSVTEVSADTFKLLGQAPMLGRDFTPSDEVPGAAPVVILRYGLWERRFGRDPAILGRTVRLNGIPATVVGVMPRGFSFPENQDLWVPLVPTPNVRKRENRDTWFVVGRLAEGVTVKRARAEMATIGRRLASAYPLTEEGFLPEVRTYREFFVGANATLIYGAMLAAVECVLLIACANLANLLLARSIGRSREMSVRIALGAGRWRIIRQLLIESVMLSSTGGILGWWIAIWGVRTYLLVAAGTRLSGEVADHRLLDYSMDYRVFTYLIAISIGTAFLFGLAPATRLSKLDIHASLKYSGRSATGEGLRARRLSALLVAAEMALAVVLLSGAGVMIRSFLNVYMADLGVNSANILTAFITLPKVKYPGVEAQSAFYDRLETQLEAIPGVESTGMLSILPGRGARVFPYELAEVGPVDQQHRPTVRALVISPSSFRTLGAVLPSGREFEKADGASGIPVAIVNQWFANHHWPGENPLGKRLRLLGGKAPEAWLTVVGVAPNIVQNSATLQEFDPVVYVPYRQWPEGDMWVMARTRVSPGSLGLAFRRAVQAIDADLPILQGPVPLAELSAPAYQNRGVIALLFVIFAAIALALASIGVHAVIAHEVSHRTQEIGIRTAIGATARDILTLVFRQGMRPVGSGLAIGLVASFGVTRVLKGELVQVSPVDPITLVFAVATLTLSATLGCWIPARRAMGVDPVVALRHE